MLSPSTRSAAFSKADAEAAFAAARHVVETHRRLVKFLRPEQTLAQIDAFVAATLEALDCHSCFLGYRVDRCPPFPSHACLSVNDCVVHGTAGSHLAPLKAGDLLKIDIGVRHRGWIGDAAWTYSIGEPKPEVRRLMECGKEALRRGVRQMQLGQPYILWAQAVQGHVEQECGLHLVRGLGGHGYGRKLHDAPFISNVLPTHPGDWPDAFRKWEPGTLVAVEPMLALGTGQTKQKRGTWPIFTADGSMSAHYEHDVLMTESGPRVLTEGMDELTDVITA